MQQLAAQLTQTSAAVFATRWNIGTQSCFR